MSEATFKFMPREQYEALTVAQKLEYLQASIRALNASTMRAAAPDEPLQPDTAATVPDHKIER